MFVVVARIRRRGRVEVPCVVYPDETLDQLAGQGKPDVWPSLHMIGSWGMYSSCLTDLAPNKPVGVMVVLMTSILGIKQKVKTSCISLERCARTA